VVGLRQPVAAVQANAGREAPGGDDLSA